MRDLLKDDTAWQWQPEHDEALKKAELTSNSVLAFYDLDKSVTMQADASSTGLARVSYTRGQARRLRVTYVDQRREIVCPNKVADARYFILLPQIHPYVYGKTMDAETDHRPLEIIMKKPLSI